MIRYAATMLSLITFGTYLYMVNSNLTTNKGLTNMGLRMTQVVLIILIILNGFTHRYKLALMCNDLINLDEKLMKMGFTFCYR